LQSWIYIEEKNFVIDFITLTCHKLNEYFCLSAESDQGKLTKVTISEASCSSSVLAPAMAQVN